MPSTTALLNSKPVRVVALALSIAKLPKKVPTRSESEVYWAISVTREATGRGKSVLPDGEGAWLALSSTSKLSWILDGIFCLVTVVSSGSLLIPGIVLYKTLLFSALWIHRQRGKKCHRRGTRGSCKEKRKNVA